MNAYSTDDEQLEQLKRFWRENGTAIILGIAIALGGIAVWQYWDNSVRAKGEAVSAKYQELLDIVEKTQSSPDGPSEQDQQNMAFVASSIKEEFPDTTYADFAAFMLAKQAVNQQDLDTAESELRWIIERQNTVSIIATAQTRLAQVLMAKQQFESALEVLNQVQSVAHQSSVDELKGDVYVELGQLDKAKEAYQLALDYLTDEAELSARPLTQIKLNDISNQGLAEIVDDLVLNTDNDESVLEQILDDAASPQDDTLTAPLEEAVEGSTEENSDPTDS